MHIMLNNLRLYIRQEHGLWRFVAPVVQNVKNHSFERKQRQLQPLDSISQL
jgi:hypothetical protein